MEDKTVFKKHDFYDSRMISNSKSGYRRRYPKHDVIFNANIFTSNGKEFHGDLDLTKDNLPLQRICNELGEEMIVLSEMLGRFGAEERPYEELEADAHAKFLPNKRTYLVRTYEGFHGVKIDNMTIITGKGVAWKKVKVRKFYEHYQHKPNEN